MPPRFALRATTDESVGNDGARAGTCRCVAARYRLPRLHDILPYGPVVTQDTLNVSTKEVPEAVHAARTNCLVVASPQLCGCNNKVVGSVRDDVCALLAYLCTSPLLCPSKFLGGRRLFLVLAE